MKVSIIVPVYNEKNTIVKTLKFLDELKLSEVGKEIIVVDDGSTDGTSEEILKFKKTKKNISNYKFIKHDKNEGKGSAVKTGVNRADGDYIIIQDADLEYNPKFIPILIEPILKRHAEIVYGTRLRRLPNFTKEESKPLFLLHYFGNRFLSFVTSILYGNWITDMETGYKIFPKKALMNINLRARGFEIEPELTAKLLKAGYTIKEVSITTQPRGYESGKKLNTIQDGLKSFWTLIKYRLAD